jgi:hypothetical protein
MQDLEKAIAELLAVARKLPPGEERQNNLGDLASLARDIDHE